LEVSLKKRKNRKPKSKDGGTYGRGMLKDLRKKSRCFSVCRMNPKEGEFVGVASTAGKENVYPKVN